MSEGLVFVSEEGIGVLILLFVKIKFYLINIWSSSWTSPVLGLPSSWLYGWINPALKFSASWTGCFVVMEKGFGSFDLSWFCNSLWSSHPQCLIQSDQIIFGKVKQKICFSEKLWIKFLSWTCYRNVVNECMSVKKVIKNSSVLLKRTHDLLVCWLFQFWIFYLNAGEKKVSGLRKFSQSMSAFSMESFNLHPKMFNLKIRLFDVNENDLVTNFICIYLYIISCFYEVLHLSYLSCQDVCRVLLVICCTLLLLKFKLVLLQLKKKSLFFVLRPSLHFYLKAPVWSSNLVPNRLNLMSVSLKDLHCLLKNIKGHHSYRGTGVR